MPAAQSNLYLGYSEFIKERQTLNKVLLVRFTANLANARQVESKAISDYDAMIKVRLAYSYDTSGAFFLPRCLSGRFCMGPLQISEMDCPLFDGHVRRSNELVFRRSVFVSHILLVARKNKSANTCTDLDLMPTDLVPIHQTYE